jgi:HlyD family secretion protein
MQTDTRRRELQQLRIDRAQRGEPAPWARRIILSGILLLMLLGMAALGYQWLSASPPEVQVARAQPGGSGMPGTILSASGYIVAHHKINVNSKVTGRLAWIGVEKGDKVKQGQVLVRLEDQEFRAQVQQATGAVDNTRAYLQQLQNGSRPEEIQHARHSLDEAGANLANDRISLTRARELVAKGVAPRQTLDDATARFEASQQRVSALEQQLRLTQIGPRAEEIARAKGALLQAEGQLAFAQSQLEATLIRAPVNGTILERTAEKGELVTSQFASAAVNGPVGSVVSLADLDDLQVELDIAQDDFAKLGPKQRGAVTTDAFPDRRYEGVISEIAPEANRQKATVQVKVQILNPDRYLRPEMNATVKFHPDEGKEPGITAGILVPRTAVRQLNGQKLVLVAFQGKAVARQVSVQAEMADGFLVNGLTGGEDVISIGPPDLKDGDRIRIKGQP